MRVLFVIFIVLTTTLFANDKVDALFRNYDKLGVPGAGVAIIKDGEILYAKGYGLANLEQKHATATNTNYRLASLTKQFTAMATMIAVERGQLSLENTLTEIFPDFPDYGSRITVRHLLNHLSGLRDYEDLIPGGQKEQLKDKDVYDILKKQNSTYFTPGSRYRYSNSGYAMLTVIVEKATGSRFADFAYDNILQPIGMTNSVFYEEGISTVKNRAYGYTYSGWEFKRTDQSITSAVLGDGGLYTSTEEWLLWDRALTACTLVSPQMQELAFTPGTLNNGSKTSYGFGWVIDTYRGVKRQSHTGSTIGFRSAVQRFPEKNLTILVMVNRANVSPWETARQIADMYLFAETN